MTDVELLARLERYYDAVPRSAARAEEIGPFTLFVPTISPSYYARPRLGFEGDISVADVEAARARQRALGLPEALEWVHATTPSLLAAARTAGMLVHEYPLMVLDDSSGDPPAGPPQGVHVRLVDADDPELPSIQAAIQLGFASPGTAKGDVSTEARDTLVAQDKRHAHDHVRDRLRKGLTVMAVAEDESGPLGGGSHQPVEDVTEIVGVGTLPAARRRGIGAAVTAALVADARARDVDIVFLSAGSDDIARVYERVGFSRVGIACVAEDASYDTAP